MRFHPLLATLASALFLSSCAKGDNPVDPYEPWNRKVHNFNLVVDAVLLKPPAKLYATVVPMPVRTSINNFYNNIYMIPTVVNDILQGEPRYAIKDTWRFLINSTFGIGGLFDVADPYFSLPPHATDLGITFAKWGDRKSPYLVLPFLGPSTIRDTVGMGIEYVAFTPYPYLVGNNDGLLYGLIGLRYLDIRSRFFDTEKLMEQALDNYTFLRDAWLQHREYLITGVEVAESPEDLDAPAAGGDYVDE